MGDFQINCSESRELHQKLKKKDFQKMDEYSHTRAATSTWPGGLSCRNHYLP